MKTINELLSRLSPAQVQEMTGLEIADVKNIGRGKYGFKSVSIRGNRPIFKNYVVQFYIVGCEIKHRLIAATSMRAA